MITEFLLTGLSAPKSFTCRTFEKEDIFWATTNMTDERYKALFKWAKETDDFWKTKWIAEIEHDGFFSDGTPKNPIVLSVFESHLRVNVGRAM